MQAEFVGNDVVRATIECAEPRTGHHQDTRVGVVGGRGNHRWGDMGDSDGIGRIGNIAASDDTVPVIVSCQVIDRAISGCGAVFVEQRFHRRLVCASQRDGKTGGGEDFHIGRGGQGAGRIAFTTDRECGHRDVVGGANGLDQVGAGDGQHMGRHVVGGTGDGGCGHVGYRHRVTRGVSGRPRGGVPAGPRGKTKGSPADGIDAIAVQQPVDDELVCRTKNDREAGIAGGRGVRGAGQGMGSAALASQGELGRGNGVASGHAAARHHQRARAGVVACTVNRGCGDADGQPGRRAADIARNIRGRGRHGVCA